MSFEFRRKSEWNVHRKGEVEFLEDILDAAQETMMGVMMKDEQKFKEIDDPEFVSDQVVCLP
jgi:arginyl-tRNA synthetase